MNSCNCNPCNNDPCSCGKCGPAKYGCDFQILANPFDESIWNVTICGATTKVKIPKLSETDTKLSTSYGSKSLIYNAEKHTDVVTGDQLGGLINLEDIRNVDVANADNCDLFVYNPSCSDCGDGCTPKLARWTKYHIPDAGDCEMEPDSNGYYKVLVKNDCGCIEECKIPILPNGLTSVNFVRDSVPDDPDFPWYYGAYNDKINLFLAQNASQYFGKFALKVTVNYGIQVCCSSASPNVNFRSLVVPVVVGGSVDVARESSILQNWAMVEPKSSGTVIPWGTTSLRGSFTFIVPKGKEAYLHHEFRLRTGASFPNYATHSLDGQRVPDNIAGQVNAMLYAGSRLNALQVIVEPTTGAMNMTPRVDPERNQLDPAVDVYPPLS